MSEITAFSYVSRIAALVFLPFATAFSLSSTTRSVAASMLSVTGLDLVWVAM